MDGATLCNLVTNGWGVIPDRPQLDGFGQSTSGSTLMSEPRSSDKYVLRSPTQELARLISEDASTSCAHKIALCGRDLPMFVDWEVASVHGLADY